jgi:flagellar biosynthetic protein FliR
MLSCALSLVLVTAAKEQGNPLFALGATASGDPRFSLMAVFREVLLGIAIGYTARLTYTSIQLAGQLAGYGMGFGMARILDPSTRTNVTIIAQYNVVIAMLVFLLIRGHHHILVGIAKSFSAVPLGVWSPSASLVGHLNTVFASIFATGFRIAIPVMAALFLTKVALAIIARTIPQMNVFIVGFPLQISVGLIAMAVSLPFFVKILHSLFASMRENVFLIFDF